MDFRKEEEQASVSNSLIFPFFSTHSRFFIKNPAPSSPLIESIGETIAGNFDGCLKMLRNFASHLHDALQVKNSQAIRRRRRSMVLLPKSSNFAAIIPGDSVAGLVVSNGILNFLNIYNTMLIVRLVLTWFPNAPPVVVSPLSTLCDPYLNIFRGIIPPLGGSLDLSPILAFLVLNAFSSTAAALPAELPPQGTHKTTASSNNEKWLKRVSPKTSTKF